MAITAAQRTAAMTQLLANLNNQGVLNSLLPGVTADQIVSFLVTACGTNADTQFTTVLGNMVSQANAQITSLSTATSALQADITAWTVS